MEINKTKSSLRFMKIYFLLIMSTVTFISNAQIITGTFAIQNVESKKDLRPKDPRYSDTINIVAYKHHNWKCETWDFIHIESNTYQLRNLYSLKTFESETIPKEKSTLRHKDFTSNQDNQYWEFLKQSDSTYLIRSKDSELYLTISSKETNSNIILMPLQNSDAQRWTLIEQKPKF